MKESNNLLSRTTVRGMVSALAVAGGILTAPGIASAQTQLYSENFDTDQTANWSVNLSGSGTSTADFFFDYSTVGIPSAPHSAGGTTRGLRLAVNTSDPGAFPCGLSVSPNGQSFPGDYEMRFDMWLNFLGPAPGATANHGTSKLSGAGIGTSGTIVQINAVAPIDSIFFACNGDGNGSTGDYRAWSPAGGLYAEGNAVYAAPGGTRNNTAAYYTTAFPGQPVPAAQNALFPATQTGTAQNGCQAWKWRDVSIKKLGSAVTWTIDGTLIATVDLGAAGTLGGDNILFCCADINNVIATDPNGLTFALFDNIRITNYASIVGVSAPVPDASESGPTPGTFTITRTTTGSPLTVNFTLTGTAINGVDYTNALGAAIPTSITFAAGDSTANIDIIPVDDNLAEFAETVVLSLTAGAGYAVGAPSSATVTIADNEKPTLDLSLVNGTMYERLTNDYAGFRLTRRGDLNAASFSANIAYSGNAVADVDFQPVSIVTIDPGSVSTTFRVYPRDNSALNVPRSVTVSIASGADYNIGTNDPVSATIVDDETPPETVLWSDNLQTDTSANWTLLFGSTNSANPDFTANWMFDYSSLSPSIPPAPYSGTDTHGLQLTVNKNGAGGGGAGLNLYPTGHSFSGNYAFRFDMYLIEGTVSTTEHALFGINHDGAHTNWVRASSGGVPAGWAFDGLFYYVEADGADQLTGDYGLNSSPYAGTGPTVLSSQVASAFLGTFKSPPWTTGLLGGGVPANQLATTTPCWADVEISQIGKVVTLRIDRTVIFSYTNTTPYTSGNIMLGYNDAFDSVGSPESSVVYANARVISLASPVITNVVLNAGHAVITFGANAADVVGQFALQAAPAVNGTYADTSSVLSSLGGGAFKADTLVGGSQQFYRIRRMY